MSDTEHAHEQKEETPVEAVAAHAEPEPEDESTTDPVEEQHTQQTDDNGPVEVDQEPTATESAAVPVEESAPGELSSCRLTTSSCVSAEMRVVADIQVGRPVQQSNGREARRRRRDNSAPGRVQGGRVNVDRGCCGECDKGRGQEGCWLSHGQLER